MPRFSGRLFILFYFIYRVGLSLSTKHFRPLFKKKKKNNNNNNNDDDDDDDDDYDDYDDDNKVHPLQ